MPAPTPFLKKESVGRDNRIGWFDVKSPSSDTKAPINALALGKFSAAIVLSHSCELDKGTVNSPRVLLAPMLPLEAVGGNEEFKQRIVRQEVRNIIAIPDVPGLGVCAADLRAMINSPRDTVDSGQRIASMTDLALRRLSAQLIDYFVRLKLPSEISDSIQVQVS